MAVWCQQGSRRPDPVDTEDAMEEKVKVEEDEETCPSLPAYPPPRPPAQVQHQKHMDPEGVDSLFVIKIEPEELSPPLQSAGDQHVQHGYEDVPNALPVRDDEDEARHPLQVPGLVAVKTEPDLQRMNCESDREEQLMGQQEDPCLPCLCKTEAHSADVPWPLYSGSGKQTPVQTWSVQQVDWNPRLELVRGHGNLTTRDAGQSSLANGSRPPSVQQIPGKAIHADGRYRDCVLASCRWDKQHSGLRSYSCPECGNTFSKSTAFHSHMRIHTGKRLYQCSHCDKSFTQSRSFKAHERTHTGEKPYQCAECGKTFTRTDVLQLHQRTHTGEKPYLCSQCGKSFNRLHIYQNHCRTHTGEKPYQCSQCAKTFTRLDVYQNHQRIHTGEKPYQCFVCERRFLYLSSLRNHERTHTEERPYRCSLCDKTFIQSGHLTKHFKKHTGDKP
ncbi:uncharacterized protein [Salminus brasiliensis]|uniref:uncharacterized protein n=1 Tax=Salminus brasiliensis TaxID=930266 RepID=UPI003B83428D